MEIKIYLSMYTDEMMNFCFFNLCILEITRQFLIKVRFFNTRVVFIAYVLNINIKDNKLCCIKIINGKNKDFNEV